MNGEEQTLQFYLIRFMPNLVRGEFINIGVLLYDPERKSFLAPRFIEDFRRARRLHPWADIDVLSGLESQLEAESSSGDPEKFLKRLGELSNQLSVAEPAAVLTTDAEAELDRLFDTYVREPRYPTRLSVAVERSRAWLRNQIRDALRNAGLWQRLDRRVPVAEFTHAGDRFRFDFGYRRNGHRGFLHALVLDREVDRAKILAYTMERIATRVRAENGTATCTAVVEAPPESDTAQLTARILAEQSIAIVPVGEMDAYARDLSAQLSA